jgi:hypothetical protein
MEAILDFLTGLLPPEDRGLRPVLPYQARKIMDAVLALNKVSKEKNYVGNSQIFAV